MNANIMYTPLTALLLVACGLPSEEGNTQITFEKTSCMELFLCIASCNEDTNCSLNCWDQTSEQGKNTAIQLDGCIDRNLCSNSHSCIANFCFAENQQCFESDLSCAEGFSCIVQCGSNQGCINECAFRMYPQDRVNYNQLVSCMNVSGCFRMPSMNYDECYMQNCARQASACGF